MVIALLFNMFISFTSNYLLFVSLNIFATFNALKSLVAFLKTFIVLVVCLR